MFGTPCTTSNLSRFSPRLSSTSDGATGNNTNGSPIWRNDLISLLRVDPFAGRHTAGVHDQDIDYDWDPMIGGGQRQEEEQDMSNQDYLSLILDEAMLIVQDTSSYIFTAEEQERGTRLTSTRLVLQEDFVYDQQDEDVEFEYYNEDDFEDTTADDEEDQVEEEEEEDPSLLIPAATSPRQ